MPRPQKGSPEAKAWAAKMREARAKKTEPKLKPQPSQASSEDTVAALLKRIEELEKNKFPFQPAQPEVTNRGVIGVFEKYVVDPKHYSDPRQALWDYMDSGPELRRHGFTADNYEMNWKVETTSYQTLDGRNIKEPKFTLEVWGIVYDDISGKPTKKYRVHTIVFHEDPQAAIAVAREKGLDVDEDLAPAFLDQMRLMRVRDWLLDLFIPPKYNEKHQQRTEEVIGNKLVDVIEISSGTASSIPFEELSNKL